MQALRRQLALFKKKLHSPDPQVRKEGVEAASVLGVKAERLIPDLCGMLYDPDLEFRQKVIEVLGEIRTSNPMVLNPLVGLLQSTVPIIETTIETLIKIAPYQPELVETLSAALFDDELPIKYPVLEVIANLMDGGKRAYPSIVRFIRRETDPYLFYFGVETLLSIGPPGPDELAAASEIFFNNEEWKVKIFSIPRCFRLHLAEDGDGYIPHIKEILNSYFRLEFHVLRELCRQKLGLDDIIQPLALALAHPDQHVRRFAAECCSLLGVDVSEALPALVEALKDDYYRVRYFAAKTLRQIGPFAFQAIPQLSKALDDPDYSVRLEAAEALKQIQTTMAN
jgi:HEAT repeat protein